jgi:hypothetical protein
MIFELKRSLTGAADSFFSLVSGQAPTAPSAAVSPFLNSALKQDGIKNWLLTGFSRFYMRYAAIV